MKEEDNIKKKCGKENHFIVPEGYFEKITDEIMSDLPPKERLPDDVLEITTWQRIKPWIYFAAMFVGAFLITRLASNTHTESTEIVAIETNSNIINDEYIEDILDYSMMDDYTLYQYLTETDTESSN